MTRKQLQSLISAGVFSAALLSGAAYADDSNPPPKTDTTASAPSPDAKNQSTSVGTDASSQTTAPDASNSQNAKQATSTDKSAAQHDCAGGANGCGGK